MITLSKIAKEAHVSYSTASKAFSGSPEVNEETRKLVFDVAKKYGCFKKFFNAKYSKYVIAIICPEFSSIHYTSYLSFLRKCLEADGCEICVAESNFSSAKEQELLDYYCKHADVDAVIMIHPQIKDYDFHEIPILILGHAFFGPNSVCISCDHTEALTQSIDYLVSRGVSSIGFIGESLTIEKFSSFQAILEQKGLNQNANHMQIAQERFEAGGYYAMNTILHTGTYPRAVICGYDNMAIGAIRCILDHGLRVPEDIAVMGMDDIPQSPYLQPPLASINTQIETRCYMAANAVIRLINGQDAPSSQAVTAQFQFRHSFHIDI